MAQSKKDELESTHPSFAAAEQMVDESAIVPLSEDRRRLAVRTNLQSHSTAWRWWLQEGMEHCVADAVSKIDIPVDVLASENDPVIPIESIHRDVVDTIPQSSLTKVSGLGHLMPMEDDRLVADWLANL